MYLYSTVSRCTYENFGGGRKEKKSQKIIAAERGYVVHAGILQEALCFLSGHPDYLFSGPG